jgi:uncharacterized Ntn-hydrolase superfamily protein
MRRILTLTMNLAGLAACGCASKPAPLATNLQESVRPVSTYSIVARDPRTGEMGVAVQSHWFSVGSVVSWAEAGVGAVATQSLVDPSYGPLGLQLMKAGRSAPDALRGLLEADQGREVRQVAMIDATGKIAAHTGGKCIDMAGQVVNETGQFSVQANLMEKDTVWGAMTAAYEGAPAEADLAERMLLALEAAEREGGDIRGKQSAALLIVGPTSTGKPWTDRKFDLRVEDHPTPLVELRRLVQVQRAYNHMNAGDLALEKGDFEAAMREYGAAQKFAPQIVEIPFWHAVTLVNNGKLEEALPIFRSVFAREPKWAELVPRLVKAGLLPDQRVATYRIGDQMSDIAREYWESKLSQRITAEPATLEYEKRGVTLAGGSLPYPIFVLHSDWPSDAPRGKKIRVTGTVARGTDAMVLYDDEPDPLEGKIVARTGPIRIPKGADKEKAGREYILRSIQWTALE